MRRIHLGVLLGALPVLALCCFIGCKSDDESDPLARRGKRPDRHAGAGGGKGVEAAKLQPVSAGKATFSGRILLDGSPPPLQKLTQDLQAGMKTDHDYCMMGGGADTLEQEYRVSATDPATIGNVFVYLEPMDGQFFKIGKDQLEGLKDVKITQPYCAFRPHCSTIFSVYPNPNKPEEYLSTGVKLIAVNNAKIAHNTNWDSQVSGKGNVPLSANGGQVVIRGTGPDGSLLPEQSPIKLECNIHSWMRAWVWPFDHPYATVSAAPDDNKSKDFGTFVIKNVPAGKVRVHIYHTAVPKREIVEEIDFSDGKDVTKDFKLSLEK